MKSKALLVVLLFLLATAGLAQEKGDVGFLFKAGSIKSAGVSYELSETMTLRASLGLSTYSSETEIQYLSFEKRLRDMDEYNVSLGLFFDLVQKKDLSLYSGVEVGYAYSSTEYTVSPENANSGLIISPISEGRNKGNAYSGNLILGVRQKIGKNIAVFGEIGFGVLKRETRDTSLEGILRYTSETNRWNLSRSGIGVFFYL